jgi:hypothetical protein
MNPVAYTALAQHADGNAALMGTAKSLTSSKVSFQSFRWTNGEVFIQVIAPYEMTKM